MQMPQFPQPTPAQVPTPQPAPQQFQQPVPAPQPGHQAPAGYPQPAPAYQPQAPVYAPQAPQSQPAQQSWGVPTLAIDPRTVQLTGRDRGIPGMALVRIERSEMARSTKGHNMLKVTGRLIKQLTRDNSNPQFAALPDPVAGSPVDMAVVQGSYPQYFAADLMRWAMAISGLEQAQITTPQHMDHILLAVPGQPYPFAGALVLVQFKHEYRKDDKDGNGNPIPGKRGTVTSTPIQNVQPQALGSYMSEAEYNSLVKAGLL